MVLVEDVLTSTNTGNALSANMGRVLNLSIESLKTRVTNLENNQSSSGDSCKLIIW